MRDFDKTLGKLWKWITHQHGYPGPKWLKMQEITFKGIIFQGKKVDRLIEKKQIQTEEK